MADTSFEIFLTFSRIFRNKYGASHVPFQSYDRTRLKEHVKYVTNFYQLISSRISNNNDRFMSLTCTDRIEDLPRLKVQLRILIANRTTYFLMDGTIRYARCIVYVTSFL